MDPSKPRRGLSYNVLPGIKSMEARPPSGSGPKPERRSTRPLKLNNKKPLPTIQGDDDPYDVVLRGLRFEDLSQTERVPRKMKSSSIVPSIPRNKEKAVYRGKSSPNLEFSEPMRLAKEMRPIPSIPKKLFSPSPKSRKSDSSDEFEFKPLQFASEMNKKIPSIRKKPVTPSPPPLTTDGNDDSKVKPLLAADMKPVPPIRRPPGPGPTGGNVRRRMYKLP